MIPIDNSHISSQVKDNFLDANSLNSIKTMGRDNDPQALKEVAKKFEAIFVQQMLKNMRAANEVFSEDSYFNSSEMQFHQDMYDQQMSLELTSGRGLGLAEALYAQMLRAYGGDSGEKNVDNRSPELHTLLDAVKHRQSSGGMLSEYRGETNPFLTPRKNHSSSLAEQQSLGGKKSISHTPEMFVSALKPYADKAASALNVKGDVLLAQAALETGWGNHVIHTERGENSFNLFNIKADARWSGEKINVSTIEYSRGVAQQEKADFRRYHSYEESFADYVKFLQSNPRYQQALAVEGNSADYAEELQKAGYATDPAYAEKIKNILKSDPIRDITLAVVSQSGHTGKL